MDQDMPDFFVGMGPGALPVCPRLTGMVNQPYQCKVTYPSIAIRETKFFVGVGSKPTLTAQGKVRIPGI